MRRPDDCSLTPGQRLRARQMTPEEGLAQRQAMLERFRQSMRFQQPGSMIGIRERQRIEDTPIPESTFIDGRQYGHEIGPPITASSNLNAMRASLYPYLQMLGLAM